MSVWAIVPIKPLNRAKSRLAVVLTPEQRERLALGMLLHNLHILGQVSSISGVLVISRDMKALAAARALPGVQTLQESGTPELNAALRRASTMLVSWGAKAVLILPADIPLLAREDVEQLITLGRYDNSLVIAPDAQRDGTNAILSRPAQLIDYSFGVGSYARHIQAGELAGAEVHTYVSERLALDVDTPEDLRAYEDLGHHLGLLTINYRDATQPLLPYGPNSNTPGTSSLLTP
ncbi:MAG: 2-phospho-L-lactate guanylyltransferase [Anaerolineae bacterium]|nr:2-phospho-L-lactate guanylyltransferase [Anaerolineae bacterium]